MSSYKIWQGDSKEVLSKMPDKSIDMAVTSPPYWGLRDYGVEGQLGLEDSPQEYVNSLCDIFDELKKVLKDDGTFWLNLGDTYAGGGGVAGKPDDWEDEHNDENYPDSVPARDSQSFGLKDKDLVGIPWRVALEMQSRGWYLRNDIIWHKQSTMPESVTDRCTTSHEHIFLFAKNKDYYFDQDAIKEKSVDKESFEGRNPRNPQSRLEHDPEHSETVNFSEIEEGKTYPKKNKRDVWTVNPASFPDAHFAVYPQELIKPCIKAGCPEKVCSECGKAYERETEKERNIDCERDRESYNVDGVDGNESGVRSLSGDKYKVKTKFKGWKPQCKCDSETQSGIVLDPFFGAGTTGVVAKRLNRKFCGIELNEEYIEIAEERLQDYEWGEGFPDERELDDKWKWLFEAEGVGEKTAFNIVDEYDSVFEVFEAIQDKDILEIDGIGQKTLEKMEEAYNE